jgi:hypothetical protein
MRFAASSEMGARIGEDMIELVGEGDARVAGRPCSEVSAVFDRFSSADFSMSQNLVSY